MTILSVERKGERVSLERGEDKNIRILIRNPGNGTVCVGIYEEPNLSLALDTYHALASIIGA